VAVLGLERNILVAIYPVALARMIRGLGLVYFQVLLVIGAYAFGIGSSRTSRPDSLAIPVSPRRGRSRSGSGVRRAALTSAHRSGAPG
jgi:hypothetical protein